MFQLHRRRIQRVSSLLVVASLVLLAVSAGTVSAGSLDAPKKPLAKNIIVMVADGSGYPQNLATDYYQYGAEGMQPWEQFPFQFGMSTYSANGWGYDPMLAWGDFEYVKTRYTDSASAATAMATGVKTYDAAIGVDFYGNPVENMVEKAEKKGMATGVITSVEWTHATPAGFAAHNIHRDNYDQIGQQMIYESAVDVIMGAGHPWYDANGQLKAVPNTFKYVGGPATWDDLVAGTASSDANGDGIADPWTLIQTRAEFQALASGPTPPRVVGTAQVYQTLQQGRGGDAKADPYVVPFIETVPTLPEMTRAALNILDDDPDGFFLMIEGGAVDWACHSNQSGRTIEERIDFNQAIDAVLAWVEENSNWGETLLVVTGDHETGYLTGPGSDPMWQPLVNNGPGVLPGMEWHSPNHTNSLIPLWAKGDAGRLFRGYADEMDPVRGLYVDNTELAQVLFAALEPVKQ